MKVTKAFRFSICGNKITDFAEGEQVLPEAVAEYAQRMGFCEKAEQKPLNKAKTPVLRNKAK